MLVHFGLGALHPEWERSVACIGTFDGVHIGHQALLRHAAARGRELEQPSVVVTFDRHPLSVLAPERAPSQLAGLGENLARIGETGIAVVVLLPFDEATTRTPASEFFEQVLLGRLRACEIVLGPDFAFGHGREGTADWLAARLPTFVVPHVELRGRRISSTAIRTLVHEGDVAAAAELLGRRFALEGVVVPGNKLGRELGYPTVNLARSLWLVTPGDGVYAGWCETVLGRFACATSIGMRPAVGGTERTIETFLIDYPGDSLYGTAIRLEFVERLREERSFPDLDALRQQIGADVEQAGRVLAGRV